MKMRLSDKPTIPMRTSGKTMIWRTQRRKTMRMRRWKMRKRSDVKLCIPFKLGYEKPAFPSSLSLFGTITASFDFLGTILCLNMLEEHRARNDLASTVLSSNKINSLL